MQSLTAAADSGSRLNRRGRAFPARRGAASSAPTCEREGREGRDYSALVKKSPGHDAARLSRSFALPENQAPVVAWEGEGPAEPAGEQRRLDFFTSPQRGLRPQPKPRIGSSRWSPPLRGGPGARTSSSAAGAWGHARSRPSPLRRGGKFPPPPERIVARRDDSRQ